MMTATPGTSSAATSTSGVPSAPGELLFACSRCYSRHPFEELSAGQQLCKKCRGDFPVVKCTYCRSEFQQTTKGGTSPICKKCESNIKIFGKPSSCEFCNILAAFIGTKCQRCTNSLKKYGPPILCEQCKLKCAFDRKDDEKKIDGKVLCYHCTLSYKRAVAKTKSTDPTRNSHVKFSSHKHKEHKKPFDKKPQRVDVTKLSEGEPPAKKSNTSVMSSLEKSLGDRPGLSNALDMGSTSDHVVALTQLREQISSLQRQLQQKDQQLLAKDRQITELKAASFTVESECRNKLKSMQRDHEQKVQDLMTKIKKMQKEMAALSKGNKQQNKSSLTIVRSSSSFTPSSLTYSDISGNNSNNNNAQSANSNNVPANSNNDNNNDQPESSSSRRRIESSDSDSNSSRGSD